MAGHLARLRALAATGHPDMWMIARLREALTGLGLPATHATAAVFVNPGFLGDPALIEGLLASGFQALQNRLDAALRWTLPRQGVLDAARKLLAQGVRDPDQGVSLETLLSPPAAGVWTAGQVVAGWALLEGYSGELFKRIDAVRQGGNANQELCATMSALGVWAKAYGQWAGMPVEAGRAGRAASGVSGVTGAGGITGVSGLGRMGGSGLNGAGGVPGRATGATGVPGTIGVTGTTGVPGRLPGQGAALAEHLAQRPEAFLQAQGGREAVLRLLATLGDIGDGATPRGRAAMLGQVPLLQRYTDATFAYRHFAMLSGLATPLKQVAGNVASAVMTPAGRQLASCTGAARQAVAGSAEAVPLGEAAASVRGMLDATFSAFAYAAHVRKTGENRFRKGARQNPGQDSGQPAPGQATLFDRGLDLLDHMLVEPSGWSLDQQVSTPDTGAEFFRTTQHSGAEFFRTTPDSGAEFFRTIHFGAELAAQAFRKVEMDNAARIMANEPILEGQDFHQAVSDLADNPTLDMLATAIEAANDASFTADVLHPSLQRLTNGTLLGKVTAPFQRVLATLLHAAPEGPSTPLALLSARFREEMAAGGADRDLAVARLALGGLVTGAWLHLAAAGYLTGNGPANPAGHARWMDAGFEPLSFRFYPGGAWHSYRDLGEPLADHLAWACDFMSACTDQSRGAFGNNRILTAMVLAVSKHTVDQRFLKGVADFMDLILSTGTVDEAAGQHRVALFFRDQAAGLITGDLSRFSTVADPETRLVQGMLDAWKARSPGLLSEAPLQRDLWGDPLAGSAMTPWMAWSGPKQVQDAYASAIDRELFALNVDAAPATGRISINGADVELTPEEQSRYKEIAGHYPFLSIDGYKGSLKRNLTAYINSPAYTSLRAIDPAQAAAAIAERIRNTYAQARFLLLNETPRLQTYVATRQQLQKLRAAQ